MSYAPYARSGSRFYTLSLSPTVGNLNFTIIGTEGGLLEAPVLNAPSLTLGPGERYEVIVDFEGIAAGESVYLENSAPAQFPNGSNDIVDVMRFDVVGVAGDTDPVPATLRPIARLQEADAVQVRDFHLKKGGPDLCGRSPWLINNLGWDDITEYPELDTVEIWRFINDSGVTHPMHMHLVFFQILDRDTFTVGAGGEILPDGNPQPPLPEEDGWKDTALVGPGEILRVIARFEDYKGKYAYHCHILEHEDHEMMRQFQTVRCGDAELDPTEACDDGGKVPADGCSADCQDEEFVMFAGSAAGDGDVSVVIAGQTVTVSPFPGATPADVAAALATAINADAGLAALGITALVDDGRLVVNAAVEDVLIADGGLTEFLRLDVTPALLWWSSLGGATGYDVVEGSVAALPSGFDVATEACLEGNTPSHKRPLPAAAIAPGAVRWFLARQDGGTFDTGAAGQAGSRDAGINAVCP